MAKNRVFLVLEIILLIVVSASLGGCGGGYSSSLAKPGPTPSPLLDTGPLGLPIVLNISPMISRGISM